MARDSWPLLVMGLVLVISAATAQDDKCSNIPPECGMDCGTGEGMGQEECLAAQCCFEESPWGDFRCFQGGRALPEPGCPVFTTIPAVTTTMAPVFYGTLIGVVKDGPLDSPITTGVTITAVQLPPANAYTTTVTSNAQGAYTLAALPTGTGYTVTFRSAGYIPAVMSGVVVRVNETTVLETLMYIPDRLSGSGTVSGVVKNAITGQPESGVTLTFYQGINVQPIPGSGPAVQTLTTGADGAYSVTLPTNYYTVQIAKVGYGPTRRTITVLGGVVRPDQNAVISPVVAEGQTRVVLSWGAAPRDLDGHLSGPNPVGASGRFHIFYGGKGTTGASPFVFQDVDNTGGFGPETITIERLNPTGVYRYTVLDFSNRDTASSTEMARSNAVVRVLRGNTILREYYVPNQPGVLWTVFEMNGDAITLINTVTPNTGAW